ncbi:hypothetical protein RQP46_005759 [Phenoliferia psychrophenolica]
MEKKDGPIEVERSSEDAAAYARIENPLHGISREQLKLDVEHFVKEKGLEDHIEIFQKGAILAQNPLDYDDLDELNPEERERIRYEHAHK